MRAWLADLRRKAVAAFAIAAPVLALFLVAAALFVVIVAAVAVVWLIFNGGKHGKK